MINNSKNAESWNDTALKIQYQKFFKKPSLILSNNVNVLWAGFNIKKYNKGKN